MQKIILTLKRLFNLQGFKNTSWNLVGTITYPLLMLVTTPIFINKLGATQFGIWMLVNSITQMMSVFNMGLGDANIRYISKYQASENKDEIKSIVSTTFGLGLVIGLSGIILGVSLSYIIEANAWFNIAEENKPIITKCIQLSFLLFSLKFIEIIILSILQGFERYDLAAKYSLLSKSVILTGNLVWVLLGGDLLILFISSSILQFLFVIAEAGVVKKGYRYLTFLPSFNRGKIRTVFHFSVWTWLQSVMAIASAQADKFIVAYFSGVQMLSYYSIGYMLMAQLHAVFSTAIGWIFPVVSREFSAGAPLKKLLNNTQAIFLAFGFSSLIFVLLFEKPIFSVWLGEETYQNASRYMTLFIYYNLALLVNVIPFYFLNGSGYARYNTYSEFVARAVNIAGMVIFFQIMENEGLVWGHILAMLVSAPIKTNLMLRFVVKERSRFLGLDSIICCGLIIVSFETTDFASRMVWLTIFLWTFYNLYIRPAEISKLLKSI